MRFNQFILYTIVGGAATLTHFICLYVLVTILHLLDPVAASVVAYLSGATVGFICNRTFVFKKSNAGLSAMSKYMFLTGFSGFNNTILMYSGIKYLNLNYLVAQVLATITIFLINYAFCKFWIFREPAYVK